MMGFMGMNMAMNAGNNVLGGMPAAPQQTTPQQPTPGGWKCSCGATNTGAFCSSCGAKKPEAWTCSCGQTQASSALTAARARKATLPLLPLLQAGRANAALPTQASSVQNAASQSLQFPRSTSATSAAGYLPIPNILRSSAPNAATPSTRTIWYNKHNKQAFTLPYGRVLCGLIKITSVEQ